MLRLRGLFNIFIFVTTTILFFYIFSVLDGPKQTAEKFSPRMKIFNETKEKVIKLDDDYNLWLIFTKVVDRSRLKYNFVNLITNLLNVSSVPLHFNVIVDEKSQEIAEQELKKISNGTVQYTFYNVSVIAGAIQDIVETMTPFFSSRPGTYYSDALFYISLGLYRVAPETQKIAVILDCDLRFKDDVLKLFQQIDGFEPNNLFALAPELSPVYRHILYKYRRKHNTTFGEYYHSKKISDSVHPKGFQGYNSGVILFNFTAIRNSEEYKHVLKKETVESMVEKYGFKGHLGDQDFYTLLGYEFPHLIHTLHCGFNRQLCTWWKQRGGYNELFDDYFQCRHKPVVLHGNCYTDIPVD